MIFTKNELLNKGLETILEYIEQGESITIVPTANIEPSLENEILVVLDEINKITSIKK